MSHLANKVRLYPTKEQEILFRKTIGCCRWIYNYHLNFKLTEQARYREHLESGKPHVAFVWNQPPTEKSLKETNPWLREVSAQALQQARRDIEKAFKNYHKHGFGRPTFHKRGIKNSFRTQQNTATNHRSVRIGKNGWIKCRGLRDDLQGRIKNITVSLEAGKWYASILYEIPNEVYYRQTEFKHAAVGIDLGVVKPVSITDGEHHWVAGSNHKALLEKKEHRRKRYQRRLARAKKGSNNREKAKLKVARAFQKERNLRKDFVEQTSCRLARSCEVIVFEDLRISNMTRSAKGTQENPGRNVRQKAGLNREMLRLGLASLVTRTQQKADRYGSTVISVDPRNTSRTCSDCGTVDKRSRESQSRYSCVHCGFTLNADKNAARNIRARGVASLAH